LLSQAGKLGPAKRGKKSASIASRGGHKRELFAVKFLLKIPKGEGVVPMKNSGLTGASRGRTRGLWNLVRLLKILYA